jgi:transcriptional regulator GlxA family with amidase domain
LHLIRVDHGAAVANTVARLAIVAPVRPGGQAQFISAPPPPDTGVSLADTRAWALTKVHEPLTLADLAAQAHISTRTLTRRFRVETGVSAMQWLTLQRVERARELLETTDLAMPAIAELSGLGSADSLRQHLLRRTALSPSAYWAAFTRRQTQPAHRRSSCAVNYG